MPGYDGPTVQSVTNTTAPMQPRPKIDAEMEELLRLIKGGWVHGEKGGIKWAEPTLHELSDTDSTPVAIKKDRIPSFEGLGLRGKGNGVPGTGAHGGLGADFPQPGSKVGVAAG